MSRHFVWEPALGSALVNAASWRLASQIVAAIPNTHIRQDYTGGIYDELLIVQGKTSLLSINRNGSLHVMAGEALGPLVAGEALWPEACRPGASEKFANKAVQALGMQGQTRNRSGHRLGYDVIAKVLVATCLDATPWDAISGEDERAPADAFSSVEVPQAAYGS